MNAGIYSMMLQNLENHIWADKYSVNFTSTPFGPGIKI